MSLATKYISLSGQIPNYNEREHKIIIIGDSHARGVAKAIPLTTVSVDAVTDDAAQDELIYKGPRTSKRQKKPPGIKSYDFLW